MVFVPYTGCGDGAANGPGMTQVCFPFGGMMQLPAGMNAPQCQTGAVNGGMAEGQTYMVPMWMPQQCMMTPYDQSSTPEHSSHSRKFSEPGHLTMSLGSLPSLDYASSADSMEGVPGVESRWQL